MHDPLGPVPELDDAEARHTPATATPLERARQNLANSRASVNQLLEVGNAALERHEAADEQDAEAELVVGFLLHGLSAVYGAVSAIAYAQIAQAEHHIEPPAPTPPLDEAKRQGAVAAAWHAASEATATPDTISAAVREALQ